MIFQGCNYPVKQLLITLVDVAAKRAQDEPVTPGTALRRAREQSGLTQAKVAAQLGVSPQAVSLWENGHGLSMENAFALDELLGTGGEIAELFGYRKLTDGISYGDLVELVTELRQRVADLEADRERGSRS